MSGSNEAGRPGWMMGNSDVTIRELRGWRSELSPGRASSARLLGQPAGNVMLTRPRR